MLRIKCALSARGWNCRLFVLQLWSTVQNHAKAEKVTVVFLTDDRPNSHGVRKSRPSGATVPHKSSECNDRPNPLHQPKWPSPLKESIRRPQNASNGEPKHVPWGAIFHCVKNQHQANCDQTKEGESIHSDVACKK
jgi:hypothetical protein